MLALYWSGREITQKIFLYIYTYVKMQPYILIVKYINSLISVMLIKYLIVIKYIFEIYSIGTLSEMILEILLNVLYYKNPFFL